MAIYFMPWFIYLMIASSIALAARSWSSPGAIVSTELALVLKFSFEDPSQYSAKSVLGEELAAKVIRPQVCTGTG